MCPGIGHIRERRLSREGVAKASGMGCTRAPDPSRLPLADYGEAGTDLTLAAATPGFALDAGERIVLTLLETSPADARVDADVGLSAVLQAVHRRYAERYDLRRY